MVGDWQNDRCEELSQAVVDGWGGGETRSRPVENPDWRKVKNTAAIAFRDALLRGNMPLL